MPASWHNRLGPRLVKAPKLLIAMELVKAATLAGLGTEVLHYRTSKGAEIDFLVEAGDGRVAGVVVPFGERLAAWPVSTLWA